MWYIIGIIYVLIGAMVGIVSIRTGAADDAGITATNRKIRLIALMIIGWLPLVFIGFVETVTKPR